MLALTEGLVPLIEQGTGAIHIEGLGHGIVDHDRSGRLGLGSAAPGAHEEQYEDADGTQVGHYRLKGGFQFGSVHRSVQVLVLYYTSILY